eukprot:gnl/MRDRNA2_/MRDRNA2_147647_c0_seq1.p1 gnl/MRDRNA2_/MRDRNA2_147647_c0~~gnl/MRDRNA2_/MRDRNA2_147647_c0_seq1.p1  ORF type:complete len:280 (-),score=56.14 gnl/MRDRNA2_/MRDRNA2_147647_c0_seq1:66-905(-)
MRLEAGLLSADCEELSRKGIPGNLRVHCIYVLVISIGTTALLGARGIIFNPVLLKMKLVPNTYLAAVKRMSRNAEKRGDKIDFHKEILGAKAPKKSKRGEEPEHLPMVRDAGQNDRFRHGVTKAFGELFAQEPDSKDCSIAEVSSSLEQAIFEFFGGVTPDYRDKVRSLRFSLNEEHNKPLRRRLVLGKLAASDLVSMKEEDLASASQKAEREEALKESLRKNTIDETGSGFLTEMYECGKCHSRNCTFFEKQTRSADEPMTIFVTCIECGNKWKDGSR